MSFNSSDSPGSLYSLVDEHGGGILAPWIKYARSSGDYSILEEYIDTAVKAYLYNGGKGKLVSISELVTIRNKQRNALLGALRRKKGRGKSGPNILDDINQDRLDSGDFLKALKILDGANIRGHKSFKYRELIWDIDQRGLSPLHQAIVNEDVHMVYFLCKKGADVHQRCYGSFFCADDQKASRTDSLEHEWVDLVPSTRYTGQMYWGEYPLSFAACTNQQDTFRLLKAYKADPNMADTNGNTVLHLTVIHDLDEMFTLAYNQGAYLHIRNNAKLTPLALSARLANKKMFDLILEFEMDILWRYGDIVCKDKSCHLDFLDGLLEELLERKWQTFGKKRLFQSLFGYLYFLLVFFISFMTRDVTSSLEESPSDTISSNISSFLDDFTLTVHELAFIQSHVHDAPLPRQCHLWHYAKDRQQMLRMFCELLTVVAVLVRTSKDVIDLQRAGAARWWNTLASTKAFPEKVLHKVSQLLLLLIVPIRFGCYLHENMLVLENIISICVVLMTTMHFLFYCRGLKFVGPFVLMVYKIIIGDMLRFLLIYSFFIIGFAQAFYVMFRSCESAEVEYRKKANLSQDDDYPEKFENIMSTPWESLMRMFIMSVGEFGAFYKNLNDCKGTIALQGKLLVTIMLLNLLIAMMTRTYEKIAETEKEWKRQWAQVILMLEQSLSPCERLLAIFSYSRPIRSDKRRRAFVVRLKQTQSSEPVPKMEFIRKKHSIRLSQNSQLHVAGLR